VSRPPLPWSTRFFIPEIPAAPEWAPEGGYIGPGLPRETVLWRDVPEEVRVRLEWLPNNWQHFGDRDRLSEPDRYCAAAVRDSVIHGYWLPCSVRMPMGKLCSRHGKRGVYAPRRPTQLTGDDREYRAFACEQTERRLLATLRHIRDQLVSLSALEIEEPQ
jgi:hypothetical protein